MLEVINIERQKTFFIVHSAVGLGASRNPTQSRKMLGYATNLQTTFLPFYFTRSI
jgi:hypothetical protein